METQIQALKDQLRSARVVAQPTAARELERARARVRDVETKYVVASKERDLYVAELNALIEEVSNLLFIVIGTISTAVLTQVLVAECASRTRSRATERRGAGVDPSAKACRNRQATARRSSHTAKWTRSQPSLDRSVWQRKASFASCAVTSAFGRPGRRRGIARRKSERSREVKAKGGVGNNKKGDREESSCNSREERRVWPRQL